MTKLTLTDLGDLQNENTAVTAINANNTAIENAIDNTLSRDGTSPNSMNATLDMNSNHIINLPSPINNTEAARKIDIINATISGSVDVGSTLIGSGTDGTLLYNSSGYIGEATVGTGLSLTSGILSNTLSSADFLGVSNNLSDLANVSTARTNLGLGTAAILDTGTSAGKVVKLDGSAKLPAVDGSQLTNLPSSTPPIVYNYNSASTLTLNNANSDPFTLGSTQTGSVFIGKGLAVSSFPASILKYAPTHITSTWQSLVLDGQDSRVSLISRKSDYSGVNPQLVLSDLTSFGVPVYAGGNQAGIGLIGNGVPSTSAFAVNIANLGGGNTGEYNSCIINIWGASPSGDTQNIITFFNGTGPNQWDNTLGATPAGARLGEICGAGSLPDGHFTETETWSMNGYAEKAFTGTTNDGTYTAPCNIVFRVAPDAVAPERISAIFDYNGNLLLGANGSTSGFTAYGNTISSSTQNSLILYNITTDPTNNPPGGCLYVKNGALKYKGNTGTVTTLAAA